MSDDEEEADDDGDVADAEDEYGRNRHSQPKMASVWDRSYLGHQIEGL